MSSNFRDFRIESINGKIQNVSSLCSYIKSTKIEEDDIPYLSTLCNKLANDDSRDNLYNNEYPLVDTLHEVLLEYYINNYNFDIDQVLDTLEVYNRSFLNIEKKVLNNTTYLLFDRYNDIDIIDIDNDDRFIDLVLNNLNTLVAGSFDEIFDLTKNEFGSVDFKETNDEEITTYAESFDINDKTYSGRDHNNNIIYKVKNGCFIKSGKEIEPILLPSLMEKDEHIEHKIINKNKKYSGFELDDFIALRDKAIVGDLADEDEVQRFYYEVRYLINTMNKRSEYDYELSEALDTYMDSLIPIYNNHRDLLTPADKRNVQNYLDNKQKNTRKVA